MYLVARGGQSFANKTSGDNPAIAFRAVQGTTNRPPKVIIDEFTTVASVWTHNQFIDGTAIKGRALGLKIAAANLPNFVDLQTGGWGTTIQDWSYPGALCQGGGDPRSRVRGHRGSDVDTFWTLAGRRRADAVLSS